MGLPAIDKTWQFALNGTVVNGAATVTSNRALLRGLVNTLLGFATSPATVSYSCTSTVAGTVGDGVNRWAADTDLVWHATTRSWMVLNLVGMNNGVGNVPQLCIDLISTAPISTEAVWVFAPNGGFTGGTTTARPTATLEKVLGGTAAWTPGVTNTTFRTHVWQSTDGHCRRIVLMVTGGVACQLILDRLKNPRSALTYPYVCGLRSAASLNAGAAISAWSTSYGLWVINGASAWGAAGISMEGLNTAGHLGVVQTSADDIDGSYPVLPLGVYSNTGGAIGRYGQIFDLWIGSTGAAMGSAYDDTGVKTLCQLGTSTTSAGLIFPSNGVILAAT